MPLRAVTAHMLALSSAPPSVPDDPSYPGSARALKGRHLTISESSHRRTETERQSTLWRARSCPPEAGVPGTFGRGRKGDEAWAASTRDAAEGFVIATRQASTAGEHVSYMLQWNELLEEKGFGTHVREASLGERKNS